MIAEAWWGSNGRGDERVEARAHISISAVSASAMIQDERSHTKDRETRLSAAGVEELEHQA